MNDALTEASFWAQVMTDEERTIVCSPVNKGRIQAWVDGRGLGHRLTVLASPIPRDTELYVVDHGAMAAWEHEQAARPVKWWPDRLEAACDTPKPATSGDGFAAKTEM